MTWTDWKLPSANAVITSEDFSWADLDNAHTDDSNAATVSFSDSGSSDEVRWTGYGFTTSDIPDGSTINGVQTELDGEASGTGVNQKLEIFDATNGVSSEKDSNGFPTTRGTTNEGGATDLWGNGSISDADVRASTFGAQLRAVNNAIKESRDASLYSIKVRVEYTAVEGTHTATGTLKAGASTISGAAYRTALASAAMQAQLAAIVAQASREAKAEGTPKAQVSSVSGTATGAPREASGALTAGGATVDGSATNILAAGGALQTGDAVVIGTADILIAGEATGALQAGASDVSGAAVKTIVAGGNLQAASSGMTGAVKRTAKALGSLVSGLIRIVGLANVGTPEITDTTDIQLPVNYQMSGHPQGETQKLSGARATRLARKLGKALKF